jgi:hypothetical protein
MWAWVDYFTSKVLNLFGKNVDGVLFLLSDWENGERRLNGLQPSRTSNSYDVMFVRAREGEEDTVFHEIKHLLDNLVRAHTGFSLDDLTGIDDWDDDVVHAKGHKYSFEYRLDEVWGMVTEAIRIRRMYEQLTLIGKLIESIKIFLNTFRINKHELAIGEGGESLPPEKEPIQAKKTLADVGRMFIGKDASPRDLVDDELGCAESVSEVIRCLVDFPIITGTWTLWDKLRKDDRFEEVGEPAEGDIIISPTGTGNGKVVGHTGVVGKDNTVMSNNSFTGTFEVTHTIQEWMDFYMGKGAFPVYYYRLK